MSEMTMSEIIAESERRQEAFLAAQAQKQEVDATYREANLAQSEWNGEYGKLIRAYYEMQAEKRQKGGEE